MEQLKAIGEADRTGEDRVGVNSDEEALRMKGIRRRRRRRRRKDSD